MLIGLHDLRVGVHVCPLFWLGGKFRGFSQWLRWGEEWRPRPQLGVPEVLVVAVVPWAARFPLCLQGALPNRFPSASLGKVRTLPLEVAAGNHGDSRTLGEVLVTRDLGCLRPWGSGVPVTLGSGTCPEQSFLVGKLLETVQLEHQSLMEGFVSWFVGVPEACPFRVEVYLIPALWWQCPEEAVRVEVVVPILHVVRRVGG